MPQPQQSTQALSEIGHLFLSSVRERQMEGAPLPRRYPPGSHAPAPTEPMAATSIPTESEQQLEPRFPQVTAVLASHLGDQQGDCVQQYAIHLAAQGLRVGLIEMDAALMRITSFEMADGSMEGGPSAASEKFDVRAMGDVLSEMSWDLDRWLMVLPGGRNLEAKCLLRDVSHWVLLSTCDHDGVINCYRMLKGLNPGGEDWPRPRLSLALLGAHDSVEADRVHRKLAGVCQQFLAMPLEFEVAVSRKGEQVERRQMSYEIQAAENRNGRRTGIGPHWQLMADFLTKTKSAATRDEGSEIAPPAKTTERVSEPMQSQMRSMPSMELEMAQPAAAGMRLASGAAMEAVSEVIDLPDGAATPDAIMAAVLASEMSGLMECPIPVPRCPSAKLVVTRDRRLTLMAIKGPAMTDLRPIAQAYQWMCENRKLIAMALPQLAIDSSSEPMLRLMVDRMDADSQAMHSMFYGAAVQVQIYRRLRWQGRTGLLLEAA